jgi:catechol 2,3-dioxygenase-like lactoylglutathione lyase family enzyme
MKIDHIGIYAHNTDVLANWYRDVLKMRITRKLEKEGRPPVYFLKGESEVQIEILPASSRELRRELTDPGYSHIALIVDNFEATVQYFQEKGVQIEGIRTTSSGWTIGYFRDIEGNYIEIVYRPL